MLDMWVSVWGKSSLTLQGIDCGAVLFSVTSNQPVLPQRLVEDGVGLFRAPDSVGFLTLTPLNGRELGERQISWVA